MLTGVSPGDVATAMASIGSAVKADTGDNASISQPIFAPIESDRRLEGATFGGDARIAMHWRLPKRPSQCSERAPRGWSAKRTPSRGGSASSTMQLTGCMRVVRRLITAPRGSDRPPALISVSPSTTMEPSGYPSASLITSDGRYISPASPFPSPNISSLPPLAARLVCVPVRPALHACTMDVQPKVGETCHSA